MDRGGRGEASAAADSPDGFSPTGPAEGVRRTPGAPATEATFSSDGAASTRPGESSRFDEATRIGRHIVLEVLGSGAMGVVLAAYDPKLDRKVALKLIHQTHSDDPRRRVRMEREAQAMARLSHPNVVTVYEVGEYAGQLFIAMEFIHGRNLRAWLAAAARAANWRTVLAVFMQAGRGLAAAHRAGLVHRDFKPDNVFVGDDGRARVGDFGLARQEAEPDPEVAATRVRAQVEAGRIALAHALTATGTTMGTPAYMAPEQFMGRPTDPRTDQFAFCVALWEALYGRRPFAGESFGALLRTVTAGRRTPPPADAAVPGWLRRVLERGLSVAPDDRFPTTDALLAALAADPTRRRWTLAGVSLVALAGAGWLAAQRHLEARRVAACAEQGASIAEVWNDPARARVREGILASGLSYAPATVDRVMPFLDAQADAWREQRTRACLLADVEGALDAELADRAVWCLDERRMGLAALLAGLARADEKVVQRAVAAAAGLPPVMTCTDGQVLAALPSPPPAEARVEADAVRTTLSEARALLAAGKYTEGLKRVRTAIADAEALGWPPITAAALRLEGDMLERSGAYAEAEAASRAAYMQAAKVRAWDVAAHAANNLVFNVGYRQTRPGEGRMWADNAEVAASFAGDPLGLVEADRLTHLAHIHVATGAYDEAKPLYARARAIWEKALGPEHPMMAASYNHLGMVHEITGAYAEARSLYERALVIQEKVLGPEHPDVGGLLGNLGIVHQATGAYAEARALHERAGAIQEKALGPGHPDVAASLGNLAMVHQATGAYAEAKALYGRALVIREEALGREHPDVARALNNLASVHQATGTHAEAKPLLERALAIQEKVLGREHPDVATVLIGLATVHRATGAYAEARPLLERALAIREEALGREHPDVAYALVQLGDLALAQDHPAGALPLLERAIVIHDAHEGEQSGEMEGRFGLARALVRTGGDRTRALVEARKAADGYRKAGPGMARELAEVEAFLAEHARP